MTSRYSFRNRNRSVIALQDDESDDEDLGPVTAEEKATAAVGLSAGNLCKSEKRHFKEWLHGRGAEGEYLEIRRA